MEVILLNGRDENQIIFDEAKLSSAQDLLDEIKEDLVDTDNLLYDAVMKISRANGIDAVEVDDAAIDMRMPERLMIQCREDTKNVSDTLDNQIVKITTFSGNEKVSGAGTPQNRVTVTHEEDETIYIKDENGNTRPATQAEIDQMMGKKPASGMQVAMTSPNQVLYGPPPGGDIKPTPVEGPIEGPIQALYGPPPGGDEPVPVINTRPQVLYGPPPTGGDMPTPITSPVTRPQVLYGPPPTGGDMPTPITSPVTRPQVLYGPPPGYEDPIPTPVTSPQALYGPPPGYEDPTPITAPAVTSPQVLYGPPPGYEEPIPGIVTSPPITSPQALYGPPPTPSNPTTPGIPLDEPITIEVPPVTTPPAPTPQPQPTTSPAPTPSEAPVQTPTPATTPTTSAAQSRVGDTPSTTGLAQHISSTSAPAVQTIQPATTTQSYSAIPKTSTGTAKKGIGDYAVPAGIGVAAGAAGLVAAAAIKKGKKDDEENENIEKELAEIEEQKNEA